MIFIDKEEYECMASRKEQEIYIFRVWIGTNRLLPQTPYRVIAVLGTSILYTLARTILRAFNFDFDHLFTFYGDLTGTSESDEVYDFYYEEVKKTSGLLPCPEYREAGRAKEVKVRECFDEVGKKLLFLYDYGDEWHFFLEFVEKNTREEGRKYPAIIERKGKAPQQYGFFEYDEDSSEDFDKSQKSLDEFIDQ
jgi:hypothetical protein